MPKTLTRLVALILVPCLVWGESSVSMDSQALAPRVVSNHAVMRLGTLCVAAGIVGGLSLFPSPAQAQTPGTPALSISQPVKRISPEALATALSALRLDSTVTVTRSFLVDLKGWFLDSIEVELPDEEPARVTVEFPGAKIVKPDQSTFGPTASQKDDIPVATLLQLIADTGRLASYNLSRPFGPMSSVLIALRIPMDPAAIPIATRDNPLGRFFWEDYDRNHPLRLEKTDSRGIRTFYFPFADYLDPHWPKSQSEKEIASKLRPLIKKGNNTDWPISIVFAHIPGKIALTDRISFREPDGTMRLGIAIIINTGTNLSAQELRSMIEHELGHVPQIWNLPRETFRIADQISERLVSEGLPLPARSDLELQVAKAWAAWRQILSMDGQSPKSVKRSGERMNELYGNLRIDSGAKIDSAIEAIINDDFDNPGDSSRRQALTKWLLGLIKEEEPPLSAPKTREPIAFGSFKRSFFVKPIVAMLLMTTALTGQNTPLPIPPKISWSDAMAQEALEQIIMMLVEDADASTPKIPSEELEPTLQSSVSVWRYNRAEKNRLLALEVTRLILSSNRYSLKPGDAVIIWSRLEPLLEGKSQSPLQQKALEVSLILERKPGGSLGGPLPIVADARVEGKGSLKERIDYAAGEEKLREIRQLPLLAPNDPQRTSLLTSAKIACATWTNTTLPDVLRIQSLELTSLLIQIGLYSRLPDLLPVLRQQLVDIIEVNHRDTLGRKAAEVLKVVDAAEAGRLLAGPRDGNHRELRAA